MIWTNVKFELPKMSTPVLCIVKNHVGNMIQLVASREQMDDDSIQWVAPFAFKPKQETMQECQYPIVEKEMVTHWMDLPESPE
jgi:hypothetical protein